jgi:hypothetical protein
MRQGKKTALSVAIVFAVGALMTVYAYPAMFNRFFFYNDEGLYLLQLRDAQERIGPFTHIYSEYGPAYNLFMTALSWITRVPLDHNGARILTLILWLAVAMLAGVFVLRQTASVVLGGTAVVASFLWLATITHEPGQPAAFAFLLAIVVLLVAQRHTPWDGINAAIIGGLCVSLLFVKVNLGVYAIAAVGITIAQTTDSPRWLRFSVIAAAFVLPFAILHSGLTLENKEVFLLVLIVESGVAALAMQKSLSSSSRSANFVLLGTGGLLAVVVALGGGALQGDAPRTILQAVLFHPLSYASTNTKFTLNLILPAIACALSFVVMAYGRWRKSPWIANTLRVATLVSIVYGLVSVSSRTGSETQGSMAIAWMVVPILLIPNEDSEDGHRTARLLLAAMIVFNELQAYPIAGSQLTFSTLLTVPAGFIVVYDLRQSVVRLGRWQQAGGNAVVTLMYVLAGISVVVLARGSSTQWSLYSQNVPLRLTGSDLVHVPSSQAAALETTVHDVASRTCSSLITYPGMLSFYVWTLLPAPHNVVVSDTINWQRPGERSKIKPALVQAHNACLITNPFDLQFWEGLDNIHRWGWLDSFFDDRFTGFKSTGYGYEVGQSVR